MGTLRKTCSSCQHFNVDNHYRCDKTGIEMEADGKCDLWEKWDALTKEEIRECQEEDLL